MQVKAAEIHGKTCSDELSFLSCHTSEPCKRGHGENSQPSLRSDLKAPSRTLPHTVNRTLTGTAQPCSLDSGGVCDVDVVTNSEEFCVPE